MVLFQVGDLGGARVQGHFVGRPFHRLVGEDPEGVHPVVEGHDRRPQQNDRRQEEGQPAF